MKSKKKKQIHLIYILVLIRKELKNEKRDLPIATRN